MRPTIRKFVKKGRSWKTREMKFSQAGVEKRFSSRRREVTNLAGVRIFCTGRRREK
jgi:hypothetical protein